MIATFSSYYYLSADLGFTTILFLSSSSIVFRQLLSELAERNSTKTGHLLGSECDLKMRVRNLGYPLSLRIGGPRITFLTTSQLNSKFNGLYLRKETDNRVSALQTTRDLLRHEFWSTNGLTSDRYCAHPP